MQHIPDLLNLEQRAPVNAALSAKALKFAFLTGDSGGALEQLLGETPVAESCWLPDCFAEDLFLDDFIDNVLFKGASDKQMAFNRAYLKRVLCLPPVSVETTYFRQQIQKELLSNQTLLKQFETVHHKLVQLRDDLDRVSDMGRVYFGRWRLGILERVKDVVDTMAVSFSEANSGIARIREYADEVRQSEPYGHLREFLLYEDGMAMVNVELRLGVDGKVRRFEITQRRENAGNRFYRGPLRRFWSRLGMLLRGYRFTGEELVAEWVDNIFESLNPHLCPMLQLIGDMEFHLASLYFRDRCRKDGLWTCHPTFLDEQASTGRRLVELFNPLLLDQDRPPVVCDVSLGTSEAMVIVTGPNSGGKTRLLQSLGLVQLLGQAGFVVPARRAAMRSANGLFVSLQARATALQPEGRLGTELVRIRRMFEKSQPGSLVILDELCSGTNPSEGEEIFYLVISLLTKLKPEAFITTHFLGFAKSLAASFSPLDLAFLQVELDLQQRPTFRFVPGVAQTSLAKHTAARLGVTRQQLLELIGVDASEPELAPPIQDPVIDFAI